MKNVIRTIYILSVALIPAHLSAQVSIPDHCFVDGEIDCTRPQCEHICYTPPTPGYESMPLAAPPSGLEKDTIEENSERIIGRPRLSMPFHDEPLVLDTRKEEKKLKTIYIPQDCPKKESVQLKLAKFDLEAHQEWLKSAEERMNISIYDEHQRKENLKSRMEHANGIDQSQYSIAALSCYQIEDKCAANPDKTIEKKLLDFFDVVMALEFTRKHVYEYLINCTDLSPECLEPEKTSSISCNQGVTSIYTYNCIGLKQDLESLYELKQKKENLLTEIRKLQCTP